MLIRVSSELQIRHLVLASVLLLVASGTAPASSQTAPAKTPAPTYASEGVIVEQSDAVYKYNADGSGEQNNYVRLKVQDDSGVRQFSVLAFPFASADQAAELQSLIVHHPDGSTTETPAQDAMEMPSPVTQQAPLYSDIKVLQVPVRGLRIGDELEYRVRFLRKIPQAPGAFWEDYKFAKESVVLEQSVILDVPKDKYVHTWSPGITPVVSESAGRIVTKWSDSQLNPTTSKPKQDDASAAAVEVAPDVAWTTFHSWDEVGQWYRSLAASRAVPNDALRAQADEIARDAKSPAEQAQTLYDYVSRRVRYVGVDFGIGRYQPHPAAEVLANQYGDCKDKDTLFQALLQAKALTAATVLIGVNLKMEPDLPSPALFNHAFTAVNLPSGRVWADTTPGVAPFGMLIQPLRDKVALLIPASGPSTLERTPAQPPFPFADSFEATAVLNHDGELKGHVQISYRSDSEILVRAIAVGISPAQWDQGTQALANLLGFSGTTSNSTFENAQNLSQPIKVSYDYTRSPFGDWDNFRIVPLFPVIALPAAPDKRPTDDIKLGALRTESAVSRIRLPEDFGADLPDAIHVKSPFAAFDKTYRLEAGELIVERKLAVLQSNLQPDEWEKYKKFAGDISLGNESWVQLTAASRAGAGPHPPLPGQNNPAAAALVTEANALENSRDWPATLDKLDQAKKLNPNQPYLWSNYGYVEMMQNQPDAAQQHYRHELELHPEETFVVNLYARFLIGRGQSDEARAILKSSFDRDPSDPEVAANLALLVARQSPTDAVAILRRAVDAKPDNEILDGQLAELLVRNHQFSDAADIARKMLQQPSGNANNLNDAAFVLAETDADLPLAEQSSRKSLEMLDSASAAAVGEANRQSFLTSGLLVASWDTLGYILMKEKKYDEARDYLDAAWHSSSEFEVGEHYGELLEASGDKKTAMSIYELARWQRPGKVINSPAADQLDRDIDRLSAAGIRSTVKDPQDAMRMLQNERTFMLTANAPTPALSSAIFRLVIAAEGLQDVLRVSGNEMPQVPIDAIKRLKLPHLVPTHSNAHLLRDAIVACPGGTSKCDLVLMPLGNIQAEQGDK